VFLLNSRSHQFIATPSPSWRRPVKLQGRTLSRSYGTNLPDNLAGWRLSRLRLSGGQLSRLAPGIASSGLPLGQPSRLSPDYCVLRFHLWPALLFRGAVPPALPAANLPLAGCCILRPVRWVRLFPMRIGLPASPGFLRPTLPALTGCCVLWRFAFDRLSCLSSSINLGGAGGQLSRLAPGVAPRSALEPVSSRLTPQNAQQAPRPPTQYDLAFVILV